MLVYLWCWAQWKMLLYCWCGAQWKNVTVSLVWSTMEKCYCIFGVEHGGKCYCIVGVLTLYLNCCVFGIFACFVSLQFYVFTLNLQSKTWIGWSNCFVAIKTWIDNGRLKIRSKTFHQNMLIYLFHRLWLIVFICWISLCTKIWPRLSNIYDCNFLMFLLEYLWTIFAHISYIYINIAKYI